MMMMMMTMIKELTATYTLSKRGADALLQSLVSRVFLRIWVQSEQNLSDEHSLPPAYDHSVNSQSPVVVPLLATDHNVNVCLVFWSLFSPLITL